MTHPHPRQRGRAAAATVEMAVLLPVFILLIVAGVDFARVYYHTITITNAARSGAMYATKHPDYVADDAGIQAAVYAETSNLTPNPAVAVDRTADPSGTPLVRVTVSWNFSTIISYPGLPRPFTVSRSVQMRVSPEAPRDPYYRI